MQDINVIWKRSVGDDNFVSHSVVNGGRYSSSFSDQGLASLNIDDCCSSDAGFYSCTLFSVNQASSSITTSAHLKIVGKTVFAVLLDSLRTRHAAHIGSFLFSCCDVMTVIHVVFTAHCVGRPRAQSLSPTSALVVWDGDPSARYTLQYQKCIVDSSSHSDEWTTTSESTHTVLGLSHCVDGLSAGGTYIFRVSNSVPSAPILLPLTAVSEEYNSSRSVL